MYILALTTGSQWKVLLLPAKERKPGPRLGQSQASPLHSPKAFPGPLTEAHPRGGFAADANPMSGTTPEFHSGPLPDTNKPTLRHNDSETHQGSRKKRSSPLWRALRNLRTRPRTQCFPWKPRDTWILPTLTPAFYMVDVVSNFWKDLQAPQCDSRRHNVTRSPQSSQEGHIPQACGLHRR